MGLMLPPKSLPPPGPASTNSRIPRTVSGLSSAAAGSVPFSRSLSFVKKDGSSLRTNPMVRSFSFVKNGRSDSQDLMTMSMDQSQLSSRLAPVYQPSPVIGRRSLDRQRSMSPRTMRKYNSTARLDTGSSDSPPGSPGGFRRTNSREEAGGKNVFSRLIAGTTIGERQNLNKGVINPFQGRIVARSPLICTNVAEGHTKAVLSVYATDELLFSASKDRTVKVWDLCRKEEVFSLEGHPNNVVCVKYSEPQRLAYTVSSAFIKVWDLRMKPSSFIKTLSSSGLTTNGPVVLSQAQAGARTLAMPPGETAINNTTNTRT